MITFEDISMGIIMEASNIYQSINTNKGLPFGLRQQNLNVSICFGLFLAVYWIYIVAVEFFVLNLILSDVPTLC